MVVVKPQAVIADGLQPVEEGDVEVEEPALAGPFEGKQRRATGVSSAPCQPAVPRPPLLFGEVEHPVEPLAQEIVQHGRIEHFAQKDLRQRLMRLPTGVRYETLEHRDVGQPVSIPERQADLLIAAVGVLHVPAHSPRHVERAPGSRAQKGPGNVGSAEKWQGRC